MKNFLRLLVLCTMLFSNAALAEDANVIVSIKPLHSLVAAVMEGDSNTPLLLVDGAGSLHSFSLKPSQMQAIEHAAIVFYMGDSFEMFLDHVLDTLPPTIRRVPMDKASGLTLLPLRIGNGFEPHVHEGEEHHHHEEGGYDLHLWMSPLNAKAMVAEIAQQLSIVFPAKRELYLENARKLSLKLEALDRDLDRRMSDIRGKPFITFHDAYQYFEKTYRLTAVGSITLHPERAPGAKHVSEIREKILTTGAACVFREPQFDSKVVDNLLEGTGAKSGMLDPEGALLTPGPELYFQLMNGIADGLELCLK